MHRRVGCTLTWRSVTVRSKEVDKVGRGEVHVDVPVSKGKGIKESELYSRDTHAPLHQSDVDLT